MPTRNDRRSGRVRWLWASLLAGILGVAATPAATAVDSAAGIAPAATAAESRPSCPLQDPEERFGLALAGDRSTDEAQDEAAPASRAEFAIPEHAVVLVHGLDDAGATFRDLIEALDDAGHVVLEFTYPNDGSIVTATDLLAGELAQISAWGVERVDIVAHSMGGLVTRDLLTRDEYYGGNARGGRDLPSIERFVMCGTPNTGSHAARLRWVAETREHVVRAVTRRGGLLGGREDGRGEAGHELRPGSDFLEELNARPMPRNVAITCVVAYAVPIQPEAARDAARATAVGEPSAPESLGAPVEPKRANWFVRSWRVVVGGVDGAIRGGVAGIGDGLVTVESAILDGAEDVVFIRAGHGSMLRGTRFGRVPPAIPVVLDRLDRG